MMFATVALHGKATWGAGSRAQRTCVKYTCCRRAPAASSASTRLYSMMAVDLSAFRVSPGRPQSAAQEFARVDKYHEHLLAYASACEDPLQAAAACACASLSLLGTVLYIYIEG